MHLPQRRDALRPDLLFFTAALALTALRVVALGANKIELQFDEAQYWFWSRTLDFGYFSKPPLIAWTIAATTSLFGDAEWAVRLAAPLAQTAAAFALHALGRRLYGPWAGFAAGLAWLLAPAVWFSSNLISTDALLLPLWSLGLYALWRLDETKRWRWAVALGAALGFGVLAKYAALYFLAGAVLAAIFAPQFRRTLLSTRGALAAAVALAIVAPNLAWNASHQFATVAHTVANANAERFGLHPDKLVEFLSGQLLIIGPLLFGALVWLAVVAARGARSLSLPDRYLIAFAAPPLLVIAVQALLSHAHANWAVAAYPSALVWLCARLIGSSLGRFVLTAALAINVAFGVFVQAALLSPAFAVQMGLAHAFEDVRGWRAIAVETAARAKAEAPLTAVVVDHRALFFELAYYGRREAIGAPPLRMWLLHADARNHAEANAPLTPDAAARVLLVQMQQRYEPLVAADFASHRPLARQDFRLGGNEKRAILFALGEGFSPIARDAAFETHLEAPPP